MDEDLAHRLSESQLRRTVAVAVGRERAEGGSGHDDLRWLARPKCVSRRFGRNLRKKRGAER